MNTYTSSIVRTRIERESDRDMIVDTTYNRYHLERERTYIEERERETYSKDPEALESRLKLCGGRGEVVRVTGR